MGDVAKGKGIKTVAIKSQASDTVAKKTQASVINLKIVLITA